MSLMQALSSAKEQITAPGGIRAIGALGLAAMMGGSLTGCAGLVACQDDGNNLSHTCNIVAGVQRPAMDRAVGATRNVPILREVVGNYSSQTAYIDPQTGRMIFTYPAPMQTNFCVNNTPQGPRIYSSGYCAAPTNNNYFYVQQAADKLEIGCPGGFEKTNIKIPGAANGADDRYMVCAQNFGTPQAKYGSQTVYINGSPYTATCAGNQVPAINRSQIFNNPGNAVACLTP